VIPGPERLATRQGLEDAGQVTEPFTVRRGEGHLLDIFAPAAMVGFFEQLSEAEMRGGATVEVLAEIAERHEMGILGPVPDTYL
jgi:hypothetical protein